MGSDDGNKQQWRSHRFIVSVCYYYRWKFRQPFLGWLIPICFCLLLLAAVVLLLLSCFVRILPPPELVLSDTFVRQKHHQHQHQQQQQQYSGRLPPRCIDTARRLDEAQQPGAGISTTTTRVVFACHRKWCGGPGHCEPCAGIGDRTRFLLSQVQDILDQSSANTANNNQPRIQIDAPSDGLSVLQSAVYTDPSGWWGEIFRYRSYDVTQRQALAYRPLFHNNNHNHHNNNNSTASSELVLYTHWIVIHPP